jgi:hypothetical protein
LGILPWENAARALGQMLSIGKAREAGEGGAAGSGGWRQPMGRGRSPIIVRKMRLKNRRKCPWHRVVWLAMMRLSQPRCCHNRNAKHLLAGR